MCVSQEMLPKLLVEPIECKYWYTAWSSLCQNRLIFQCNFADSSQAFGK